jgi:hypothetical protein
MLKPNVWTRDWDGLEYLKRMSPEGDIPKIWSFEEAFSCSASDF